METQFQTVSNNEYIVQMEKEEALRSISVIFYLVINEFD